MRRRLLATIAMAGVLVGSVLFGTHASTDTNLAGGDGTIVTSSKLNRGW